MLPTNNKTKYKAANKFYRLDSLPEVGAPGRKKIARYYQARTDRPNIMLRRGLVAIAVIIIGQSIFQLPWLALSKVEIKGSKYIPATVLQDEVRQILTKSRWGIFKNSNFFLFTSFDLIPRLENEYHLTNVHLDKKFPHTLVVSVEEKVSPFIRQTPEGYYALDYKGETIGQISKPEATNIVIADERADRSQNISLTYLEQATKLVEAWPFKPEQLGLDKFHLTDTDTEVIISSNKGYRIFFSTTEAFAPQMARLQEVLNQNAIPEHLDYIDLRFENNIYFK